MSLPIDKSKQEKFSKEIEQIWGNLEKNLCNAMRKSGLELAEILGSKYYLN